MQTSESQDLDSDRKHPDCLLLTTVSGLQLPQSTVFDLNDMMLLHYFCTKTYLTLALRPNAQITWRDVVLSHGFRYPFLLRGLLALAALHKASDSSVDPVSRRDLREVSSSHHTAALAGFIPELNHPTKDNCASLFTFSMVLTVLTLASTPFHESMEHLGQDHANMVHSGSSGTAPRNALDQFIEVMTLLQGVYTVFMQTKDWLLDSDVKPLMRRGLLTRDALPDETLPVDAEASFRMLEERLDQMYPLSKHPPETLENMMDTRHSPDNSEPEMYRIEIQVLRHLFLETRENSRYQAEAALAWATIVPNAFNCLLQQRQPMALAILVHSATCLTRLEQLWWMAGWPERLVADVSSRLDESWSEILAWPRKMVNSSRVKDEIRWGLTNTSEMHMGRLEG